MKALKMFAVAALAVALFGGVSLAGDCPAAVKVQQAHAAPVVIAQAVVAAPVYVVPAAPTVAIVQQQVIAVPVVQQVVVQKHVQQRQVIVQQQRAPVTRSTLIQRSITR